MKIKDYIKQLQIIAERYPDAQLVYSMDEEGNHYEPVSFWPIPGHFDGEEFDSSETKNINAVCVN